MFYFLFYRFKFYFMVKLIFKGDRGYFEITLSCKLKNPITPIRSLQKTIAWLASSSFMVCLKNAF
ncbi:hypothetical protein HPHPA4_0608 [Helicobacter pylori Hp A-4]|nr:hypothetical protein HPHPA4_0608 [Helicobacter pylori Hp A-4]